MGKQFKMSVWLPNVLDFNAKYLREILRFKLIPHNPFPKRELPRNWSSTSKVDFKCPKFDALGVDAQIPILIQLTLKLKRFRSFFGKCFCFFPVFFRPYSGKGAETGLEKKAETFSGKRAESFKF